MAVQTAGSFSPDKHEPLSSLRVDKKKIQACKCFHCIGATHPAWFRSRNAVVNDEISQICGYLEICVIYVLFLSVCVSARNLFVLDAPVLLATAVTVVHSCLKRKVGQRQRNWFNKGKR